ALRWKRIAVSVALILAVIALVPPLRRVVADATSKVILFVAAPLGPSVSNFTALSANTRILAADGSQIAELNGGHQTKPVKLEQQYSKKQLLEHYLNQVYFGHGAYGIGAASQDFFGVPPEQLTPAQAATLAGKIQAPEVLDPRRDPAAVQKRRDRVLGNMRKHGWLSADELTAAKAEPLRVQPPTGPAGQSGPPGGDAAHFVQFVIDQASGLDELGGSPESRGKRIYTGGYTIQTTLDPKARGG